MLKTNHFATRICEGKFNKVELEAPIDYWMQTNEWLGKNTNGMGPDCWYVNIFSSKMRNQLLLLDVKEAAVIHDYMYGVKHEGWSLKQHLEYKKFADEMFLSNLYTIINDNHNKELQKVRWFKWLQVWFINMRYEARNESALGLFYLVQSQEGDQAFLKNKDLKGIRDE